MDCNWFDLDIRLESELIHSGVLSFPSSSSPIDLQRSSHQQWVNNDTQMATQQHPVQSSSSRWNWNRFLFPSLPHSLSSANSIPSRRAVEIQMISRRLTRRRSGWQCADNDCRKGPLRRCRQYWRGWGVKFDFVIERLIDRLVGGWCRWWVKRKRRHDLTF